MPKYFFRHAYNNDPLDGRYEAETEAALIERFFPTAVETTTEPYDLCGEMCTLVEMIFPDDDTQPYLITLEENEVVASGSDVYVEPTTFQSMM